MGDNPGVVVSKLDGRKVLNSQAREMASKVMDFMKTEADAGTFVIDCKKVRERVQAATGVSKNTQIRISAQKKKIIQDGVPASFKTPNKIRNRPKRVTGLDDFDLGVVRRIVNNFYLVDKCLPTVNKIQQKMQESMNFRGSKTSVRRILRRIGYRWRKTKTNKRILMESHDVAYQRFVFLKKISQFRAEGRPIVYNDESYIDSSHVSKKGWSDDSNAGIAAPINKGKRLIMLHAGGEMGFIEGCLTMWEAQHKTGDYHDNMNHKMYMKWLTDKLIPNLPEKSVLVIDNAPYHNVQLDKSPTSNSKKSEMEAWLLSKNIPFHEKMLKVELYELIKRHKPAYKKYVIDDTLQKHGHSVLRLPPYHPELNAIELIWADVKNWVAANNVTFKIADVKQLAQTKFENISVEDWKRKCENVKRHEQEFLGNQHNLDDCVESFIIDLGADSSDDEAGFSDEGSEQSEDSVMSGVEELDDGQEAI